jgi:hypothetical protein
MSVPKTTTVLTLAQMFHNMHPDTFVCADPEKEGGIWYEFKNHHWGKIKTAILHKKIKQSLCPEFLRERKRLCDAIRSGKDLDDDLKKNGEILKNLDSIWFRDTMIWEMVDLFYDENVNFIERLDANVNLIGFNNGVFNIETMSFREGKPDDYICKNENRNYQDFSDAKICNIYTTHKLERDASHNGFIYLLREREFIKTDESVFKFGKTKSSNASRRINSYPKDSEIYYIEKVKDCDQLEKEVLAKLCINFRQRTDIGKEYFEGNIEDIMKLIKSNS